MVTNVGEPTPALVTGSVTLVLPVPPPLPSKNGGRWTLRHWSYQLHRERTWGVLAAQWREIDGVPWTGSVRLDVWWVGRQWSHAPKGDTGRLRLTAAVDAIVSAGLIVSASQITWGAMAYAVDSPNPRVELTLTREEATDAR